MARVDIAGLLTGIGQAPIDPMLSMDARQRSLARVQELGGQLRRGVGALTGVETRTTQEMAQQALAQLDPNKREDREKILQIVQRVNPERVPALREEFTRRDKQQAQAEAAMTSSTETRAAVARQVKAEFPDLAEAIIAERDSGSKEALKTGLNILKERGKPSTARDTSKVVNLVDTTTNRTVGTAVERNGELYLRNPDGTTSSTPMSPAELENRGISASYVKPSSPLVSTAPDPAIVRQQENRQALMQPLFNVADTTAAAAEQAPAMIESARRILTQVDRDANTGTVQGMTQNIFKFAQSLYTAAGMPIPQDLTDKLSTNAVYKRLAVEGLLPRIAEQGRGFTDPEREFFLNEALPSYNQTFQFNELSGQMQLAESKFKIEEAAFADARKKYFAGKDEVPPRQHAEMFSDYTTRLPMTKFEKHTRIVGGQEVTYDRLQTIEDNARLYQYWTEGQAPRGFVITGKGGTEEEFTWGDINATAKKLGTTPRELLAQAHLTGNLLRAIY